MKILLTEQQINEGVRRLAGAIRGHYEGRPLTIVGVLIGRLVLLVDDIFDTGNTFWELVPQIDELKEGPGK